MPPRNTFWKIAAREFGAFFASPVAYLFLAAFLGVSLFVFFWVETFFSRNIADVRPLFDWMPVLLIFLVAALTMRSWSEERRSGNMEVLLTAPVSPVALVLGKFLAGLGLVAVALLLTLPLPVTVWFLGPLDFGPVVAGYLAALLLAGAYLAIGLWVSSRTDNQIVALIGTVGVCTVFYLLGIDTVRGLFGHQIGQLLALFGTGSRFESITRGVVDARDLYYYLSLAGVFLTLNLYELERLRWDARSASARPRHRLWRTTAILFAINLVVGNLWLAKVDGLRADFTAGRDYSLSQTTRDYLAQLREPLRIRGYFSAQTHPKLAPLVPRLRDLLREYQVAGHGNVTVEFLDPRDNPDIEREAGERFGVRPVAFRSNGKYQSSVVNSYFDIVLQYGDQFEKLSYRDLIEVKVRRGTDLDVRLRNPEYDITRTIKKILYAYTGAGDVFAGLAAPVTLEAFISSDADLPEALRPVRDDLSAVLQDLSGRGGDRFKVEIRDPRDGDGALAKTIRERYGYRPLAVGLLDDRSFYFYLHLKSGKRIEPISLPESLDKAGLKQAIEAGLKRFKPGVLRTLAVYTPPPANPRLPAAGGGYSDLLERLRANAVVVETDLKSGRLPEAADALLVVDAHGLDSKQRFAIDQYLMRGGTVLLAGNSYRIDLGGRQLAASKQPSGLEEWLKSQGLEIQQSLVLDPANTPFPIPVDRNLGGFVVQEIQQLPYPYFPDIRGDGLDSSSGITTGLGQLTLNWASPIVVDAGKNTSREVLRLLQSSPASWTSDGATIQPDPVRYPPYGFPTGANAGRKLLAVAVEGRFDSAFKGQTSPLLKAADKPSGEDNSQSGEAGGAESPRIAPVIESSPDATRLIVVASGSFLADSVLDLSAAGTGTRYTRPLEFVENALDWALEDRGLLLLRGRGQFSRTLAPVGRQTEQVLEYANYMLALGGIALIALFNRLLRRRRERYYDLVLGALH